MRSNWYTKQKTQGKKSLEKTSYQTLDLEQVQTSTKATKFA
jgi:hypothetical protein